MAHIDAKEFFREFTLRICSSLDIEKALERCLDYISGIMPADKLLFSIYKPEIGAIEIVAKVAAENEEPEHLITALPPHLRQYMEALDPQPHVRIVENILEDDMIGFITKKFDFEASSAMISRLMIEGNLVGYLCVCAQGKGHYNEDLAELWKLINEPTAIALANSLRYRELLDEDNRYYRERLREVSGTEIVGGHSGLKSVVEKVRKVATLDSPVLMLGETGVGKEVIANMIHDLSDRRNKPLITVNCGAIPDTLLDSELFGHERGAFTGALSQKRGRFERADRGTIFLDEIGELPLQAQTRLLRVLQSHEIERVGGMAPIPLDIRVIAAIATHIRGALEYADGKIQGPGGAAELLGVNPTTLRSRMDRLGIQFKKRKA